MAARPESGGRGGLSGRDLLIAAIASGGAAVIVSYFWKAGTVMAAAITPVLVSLLREAVLPKAIDRPARALAEVRTAHGPTGLAAAAGARLPRSRAAGAGATTAETPPETQRLPATEPGLEDVEAETAGAEEPSRPDRDTERLDRATRRLDERPRPLQGETEPLAAPPPPVGQGLPPRPEPTGPPYGAAARDGGSVSPGPAPTPASRAPRVYGVARRARVRIAVITGLLGFAIAAVLLTVPELVAGESVGGGEGRTTLFSPRGGEGSEEDDGAEDRVTDGDGGESPDGDGEEDGQDAEPTPEGDDGSSEPDESSGERSRQEQRSIAPRDRSAESQDGESGASRRSSGQRAPTEQVAPGSPSREDGTSR